MNTAFIMKLGHSLLTNSDALWVQLLRGKYKMAASLLPEINVPSHSSALWKGIAQCWPLIIKKSRIVLGNGERTHFWSDPWLPGCGPLLEHPSIQVPTEAADLRVADYVNQDGHWIWEAFQHLLPGHIIGQIMNMIPPLSRDVQDRVIWGESSDGIFSVRTAYRALQIIEPTDNLIPWDHIWRWDGPERIKTFLWLVTGDKLMTNSRRFQRRMSETEFCPRCQCARETTLHAIRDCNVSMETWRLLVDRNLWEEFLELNLLDWLLQNVVCSKPWSSDPHWQLLFGITAWFLWRSRNDMIFNGIGINAEGIARAALGYKDSVLLARKMLSETGIKQQSRMESLIAWTFPPLNWTKINVDGASSANGFRSGCGGVLRDSSGDWITGFCKNLGSGTALNAELWAILVGLEVAWSKGFRNVWLEGDSQLAQQLILKECSPSHPSYGLILRIKILMAKDWNVKISHIYREGNGVADWLAAYASNFSWPVQLLDDPPPGCLHRLLSDQMGVHWPRLVPSGS